MTEFNKEKSYDLPDVEDVDRVDGRALLFVEHFHERFDEPWFRRTWRRIIDGAFHPEEGILKPRAEINPPDIMP